MTSNVCYFDSTTTTINCNNANPVNSISASGPFTSIWASNDSLIAKKADSTVVSSFTGYANTTAIDNAVTFNVSDVQLTTAGIYVLNSQGLQSNLSLSRTITSSPNQRLNGGV